MFTRFMDMHSGGGRKLDWEYIYIEAPYEEAKLIFYNRFGRDPNNITCDCCGEDYSVDEAKSLDQITGFQRGCEYDESSKRYIEEPNRYTNKIKSVEKYLSSNSVHIILKEQIKPEELQGGIHREHCD